MSTRFRPQGRSLSLARARARVVSRHPALRRPRAERGTGLRFYDEGASGEEEPGEETLPYGLAERAAVLLGGGGAGPDPPGAGGRAGASGAVVLPRAVAVACAREAVRRSRERRLTKAPVRRSVSVSSATAAPTAVRRRGVGPHEEPVEAPGPELAPEPGYEPGREPEPAGPHAPEPAPVAVRTASAWERARLAVGERLPTWVQLRCGIEPRTLLALVVVLVVALGFAVNHFWTGRPEPVPAPEPRRVAAGDAGDAAGTGGLGGRRLVVDVVGKVRDPGIHRLPNGARVADALRAAGGLRPGTGIGGLNRARRLVDGEQVVVGAASPGGVPAAGSAPAAEGGGGTAGAAPGGPVSLNSASAEQLQELPGVGPVLAQHIVEYREANGGFTSVDQLREVDGIGEKRFGDIKPKVGP